MPAFAEAMADSGLQRVTGRAVDAQYLTPEAASQWLAHLGTQPFFASMTRFIVTARATNQFGSD